MQQIVFFGWVKVSVALAPEIDLTGGQKQPSLFVLPDGGFRNASPAASDAPAAPGTNVFVTNSLL